MRMFGVPMIWSQLNSKPLDILAFTSLLARRCILLHWKSKKPPTTSQWLVDSIFCFNWKRLDVLRKVISVKSGNVLSIIWSLLKSCFLFNRCTTPSFLLSYLFDFSFFNCAYLVSLIVCFIYFESTIKTTEGWPMCCTIATNKKETNITEIKIIYKQVKQTS